MANQNTLTITKKDPSGAYSPISGGWEKTVASGLVKYMPTAVTKENMGPTIVADTGEVAQTDTKTSAVTGFTVNGGGNDTYQLQGYPAGATMNSASLSMAVSVNGGTDSTGTFTVAGGEIDNVSASGLITFTGTGGLDDDFEAVISYTCDIKEAAVTSYGAAIPVMGVEAVNLYAPASGHAEIGVKWEWTDDEIAVGSGSTAPTWTQFYAYAANSEHTETTHILDDKARFIRLSVLSTDAGTDGVIEANTVLGHVSTGAYASWTVTNDASNNKPIVALGAEATAGSIGGIGVDPS